MGFYSSLKKATSGPAPVQTPEQSQGLGNISVANMLKATNKALIPGNVSQVATIGAPILTSENFGRKPISAKDAKQMQHYAQVVAESVRNGKEVLESAAQIKEQEAILASAHGKYLTRVSDAELRIQRANTQVATNASKAAVTINRLGLHIQNAVGSARNEIELNTAQYQQTCAW